MASSLAVPSTPPDVSPQPPPHRPSVTLHGSAASSLFRRHRRPQTPPGIYHPAPTPRPPSIAPLGPLDSVSEKIKRLLNRRRKKPDETQDPDLYAERILNDEETVARNTRLEIKEDDVMAIVLEYKSFSMRSGWGLDIVLPDLPAVNSLGTYGVNEAQSHELWSKETRRLVSYVNNPEEELRFPSHTFFKEGSPDAYRRLAALADRIVDCNSIRMHENELLMLVNCKDLHDQDGYRRLYRQLCQIEIGPLDKVLTDDENRIAIFALVDYLTAVFARFLCHSAYSFEWQKNCLAFLATWSAAIKVISERPSSFASISLDTAADQIAKIGPQSGQAPPEPEAADIDRGFRSPELALKEIYYVRRTKSNRQLETSLRYVLVHLVNGRYGAQTKYELCSVVYETGFEGFQTLLFQTRDSELLGTSSAACLNIAHSACAVLDRIIETVKRDPHRSPPPTDPTDTPPLTTMIRWFYTDHENQHGSDPQDRIPSDETFGADKHMALESMEDIISVMIPIVITTPWVISETLDCVYLAAMTAEEDDPIRSYTATKFKAFFRMYTDSFESSRSFRGNNVSSLSRGLMTRDKLLSGPKPAAIPTSTSSLDGGTTNTRIRAPPTRLLVDPASLREANQKMNEWIFDEKAVIVQCPVYVWSVIAAAFILVIGGLAIGFTVRNRLTAVDPFNITTYCWVLAGFLVLICKSIRVESWSWRDFLHFRVQCRSVSELRDFTGVNEQLIIAKLLHEERTTILHTRGPYNSAFTRSAEDGFSIDVPLTMWTMLLSGLIMVQVLAPHGRALVCFDVRRGTKYTCVVHNNKRDEEKRLVCINPTTSQRRDAGKKHLFPLRQEKLEWTKVQGLFNIENAEFM